MKEYVELRQAFSMIGLYLRSGTPGPCAMRTAPKPNNVCPQTDSSAFGNTDIWHFSTAP